jgi:hypothetical protein
MWGFYRPGRIAGPAGPKSALRRPERVGHGYNILMAVSMLQSAYRTGPLDIG